MRNARRSNAAAWKTGRAQQSTRIARARNGLPTSSLAAAVVLMVVATCVFLLFSFCFFFPLPFYSSNRFLFCCFCFIFSLYVHRLTKVMTAFIYVYLSKPKHIYILCVCAVHTCIIASTADIIVCVRCACVCTTSMHAFVQTGYPVQSMSASRGTPCTTKWEIFSEFPYIVVSIGV